MAVLEATVWTIVTARTTVAKTERPVIGGQVHHSGEMMITGEIGMSHLAITVEVVALIATNDEITMIEVN